MTEHDDPRSDLQLIDAANGGDPTAFEALYRRHRDWVMRMAMRVTGDHNEALDVLQETFTYFWRKFPGFTLTASLTTFLYPAVRHIAIARQKRRRRVHLMESPPEPVAPPAEPGDARAEVRHLIARLPEAQREVLMLRFVDDLSLQEIAEALQIPLGTVKSRLHHAVRSLRKDPVVRKYFDV